MATYNINSGSLPSQFANGDIVIAPYSGAVKSLSLPRGTFVLEVVGAPGGYRSSSTYGGLGGYSKGTLTLTSPQTVYLRTGGQGNTDTAVGSIYQGGFNGGGKRYGYHGGGGASDIRIGTDSLYARVIVAGGGGSDGASAKGGMYGGGESGGSATMSYGTVGYGGTQTGNAGGSSYIASSQSTAATSSTDTYSGFGFGGNGVYYASGYGGAGGGGWYGGCGAYPDGSRDNDRSGGGGSGYIYTSSTASNYPTGCLLNSSFYLTSASTVAGNTSFIDPETGSTTTGRAGNGYIKITMTTVNYSYTITSSAGSNGSISPSGTTSVTSGNSQTYTITPNTGYNVSNVLVDGASVGAVTTYTFSNVSANHTISATFAIQTFTITPTVSGSGGTISPSTAQTVNYGSNLTFTFTPNSGYGISNLAVDGSGVTVANSYTFSNITTNHTIQVTFGKLYTVDVVVAGTDYGTASPTGNQSVISGQSLTITFTANTGCNGTVYVNNQAVATSSPYTLTNVTSDMTVYMVFSKAVMYADNIQIKKIYKQSDVVAHYNGIETKWVLNEVWSPIVYVWDDSQTWVDTSLWTENT